MMNPSDHPAGWYPDPTGRPGQMYWDGQRWQTPSTFPPASTPWTQPYVDMARPQLDKGRRFWSGQSPGRKTVLVLAGLLVVMVLIVVPITVFGGSGSSGDGNDNNSYKQGFSTGQGTTVSEFVNSAGQTPESACDSMFTSESVAFKLDRDPFMRGCQAGYKQAHP
jgi:hypothetical protein